MRPQGEELFQRRYRFDRAAERRLARTIRTERLQLGRPAIACGKRPEESVEVPFNEIGDSAHHRCFPVEATGPFPS